jgi:hypothetical protein
MRVKARAGGRRQHGGKLGPWPRIPFKRRMHESLHAAPSPIAIPPRIRLSPGEAAAVLGLATSLGRSAREGDEASRPLNGKNIGLLCDVENEEVQAFREAAVALGARVAVLRFRVWDVGVESDAGRIGNVLGKLYDLIAFQDTPSALRLRIALMAGVPVFACRGINRPDHPVACLAEQLPGDGTLACKRHLVLQALLLNTMG